MARDDTWFRPSICMGDDDDDDDSEKDAGMILESTSLHLQKSWAILTTIHFLSSNLTRTRDYRHEENASAQQPFSLLFSSFITIIFEETASVHV